MQAPNGASLAAAVAYFGSGDRGLFDPRVLIGEWVGLKEAEAEKLIDRACHLVGCIGRLSIGFMDSLSSALFGIAKYS